MALPPDASQRSFPSDSDDPATHHSELPPRPHEVFSYTHSRGFPEVLEQFKASLFLTTYQAGKLIAVRSREGRLNMLLRTFPKAMGLALDPNRFAIATRDQVWSFRGATDLAAQLGPEHDTCFVPRTSHVTGDIHCHDIAWGKDQLWLVNTRFSCLCTLHTDYSFVPRWKPAFISSLSADDRCHLNGLEVVDGEPRYVTAFGQTDESNGWRADKAHGGCVIDVATNAVIADGLCMPHSPRFYDGRMWFLESGTGTLATVNTATGQVDRVAELPGYVRGLAFLGRYAFLGLSQLRDRSSFVDLPLTTRPSKLRCGIWVVDITTGQQVAVLQFEAGVEEIFDVRVLPGIPYPAVVGFQKDTIHGTFVVPDGAIPRVLSSSCENRDSERHETSISLQDRIPSIQ